MAKGKRKSSNRKSAVPRRSEQPQTVRVQPMGRLPAAWQTKYEEATRCLQRGELQQAVTQFEAILRVAGNHAPSRIGFAEGLVRGAKVEMGLQEARRAVLDSRNHPDVVAVLAELLLNADDVQEARTYAESVLQKHPANERAMIVLIQVLEQLRCYEEALDLARQGSDLLPNVPYLRNLMGRLLRRGKRMSEACTHFRKILDSQELQGDMRTFALHEFALSLDGIGEFDEAFAVLTQWNDRVRESPATRALRHPKFWEDEIDAFESDVERLRTMCKEHQASHDEQQRIESIALGSALVFLVGFPRSGTTMTEQVLAAHPAIESSDEMPYLHAARKALLQNRGVQHQPIASLLYSITNDDVMLMRTAYCNAVRSHMGYSPTELTSSKRFVDKLPLNMIDLPLIELLFPQAKVIVALRDPRDVCLSCFMQNFGINQAMQHFNGFESTVAFYTLVMRWYKSWTLEGGGESPLHQLTVRYEDSVNDLESQARRMLSFLELDWNDQVLRFNEIAKDRVISTPTFADVAQPIYRRSLGRWKNYQRYFELVSTELAPFVEAFGYEPTPT